MTSPHADRIIGRILALTLFGLSLAVGLARTGTTVITTMHKPVAAEHGAHHGPGGGIITVR